MERKELIELFKNIERANHPVCNGCPLKYTCDKNQITRCLLGTAADMLEADEQQIEDLQKQVNELIKNETHSSVIKAMSSRIAELEKELEIWTARSFEGKIASMAFKNLNLKIEISKLTTQMLKIKSLIYDLENMAKYEYDNDADNEYLEGYFDGVHQAAKLISTTSMTEKGDTEWQTQN